MKKKHIEKVPYLTLPDTVPDESVKFVGRTAWKNIGHERHLILEVYRNKKEDRDMPVVRYAATKKDWGIYEPGYGWSRRRIESNDWGNTPCWYGQEESGKCGGLEKENGLYSGEDLKRIKEFFGDINIWDDRRWWEYFSRHEEDLKHAANRRKYERRMKSLKEREENTPELKKEELLEWADRELFGRKHYLYYKKRGPRAAVCCSACGGTYSGKWKEGISYESQFEAHIEEPRERHTGKCRLCGERGEYKPQGKAKTAYRLHSHVFLADRYPGNGVVLRYIELGKEWQLEITAEEYGGEMHGAYEKLDGIEIARTYFLPGKEPQTDFHKHNPWEGKDFWDDCNLCGLNSIAIREAPVHPDSWENLKGTCLQYSGMKEYMEKSGTHEVNMRDYMDRYMHFPQMEMLSKMGMWKTVKEMTECRCGCIMDAGADRPENFLGIRKDRVKKLAEAGGDIRMLEVL